MSLSSAVSAIEPVDTGKAKFLRPSIVAVLFDFLTARVLVGRIHRNEQVVPSHNWSMVEGGIEIDRNVAKETVGMAARREMGEEVSAARPLFITNFRNPLAYEFPVDNPHPKYSGKGIWPTFYHTHPDRVQAGIDPDNAFDMPNFSSTRWVELRRLPGLLGERADTERRVYCHRLVEVTRAVHGAFVAARKQNGSGCMSARVNDMLAPEFFTREDFGPELPVIPSTRLFKPPPRRPT